MNGLTPGINRRLCCMIEDGELVIRIGIETLAFAAEHMNLSDGSGRSIRVCDVPEFAKDVRAELMREEEDGSSPLTNVLDKACLDAWEEGSIGCHD